jgi:hypothetical protein
LQAKEESDANCFAGPRSPLWAVEEAAPNKLIGLAERGFGGCGILAGKVWEAFVASLYEAVEKKEGRFVFCAAKACNMRAIEDLFWYRNKARLGSTAGADVAKWQTQRT